MNTINLIFVVIAFGIFFYEIYSGEIISGRKYGAQKTNRKTEPGKFWLSIFIQFLVLVFLLLYALGLFGRL